MNDSLAQYDSKYIIENFLFIADKQGNTVPFKLNEAQSKYYRNKTDRDIILKARQLGFCLDKNTKILSSDLKWIPIKDIAVGQEVVAVDENIPGGRGKGRKMRTATVEAKHIVRKPAFKLTMDDGRELIATAEHRFLTCPPNLPTNIKWRAVGKLDTGYRIRHITKPWDEPTMEDAWFSGMLDGEGSLRQKKTGGAEVSVCQVDGPVWERLMKYAKSTGLTFREEWDTRKAGSSSKLGNKPVGKIVFNRMNEIFQVIGKTRPTRFADKRWWEGKDFPGKRTGDAWSRIISIEPVGVREMIDLQTSEGTFIAEGFVSHNSSLILAMFLVDCLTHKNLNAVVISHEKGATQRLFQRVKFYIENIPAPIKVNLGVASKTEFHFLDTNSRFFIGTAGAKAFGHGETIQRLHVSEISRWDNPSLLMGLLQAVPKEGSHVVIESTANGTGNDFYQRWHNSKRPDNPYTGHFFPWTDFDEYATDPPASFSPTPDEQVVMGDYNLTNAQVYWMRLKTEEFTRDERGVNPEDFFKEQYPANEMEAFVSTSTTAFSVKALQKYLPEKPRFGKLHKGGGGNMEFLPDNQGYYAVFKQPEINKRYSIGCDVASGAIRGNYSTVVVLENDTLEQVAEFRAKVDTDVFAEEIAKLGEFYNNALVAVESNNQGLAVLVKLKDIYKNIYYRQSLEGGRSLPVAGWRTDSKTRPYMIDQLAEMIREHQIILKSDILISECMNFVRDARGRYQAAEGAYDDLVIALAIALQMYKFKPVTQSTERVKEEKKEERNKRKKHKRKNRDPFSSVRM